MTATTERPTDVQVHAVTLPRVLRSEWVKARSLRSTWLTMLVAVVALIGISALISWATNNRWDRLDAEERASFEPIFRSLAGVNLAQLAIVVLGVLLISGEYSTGMVRSTFAAVPTRWPVLVAKTLLFGVVTFAISLVSAFVAFLLGQQLLGTHGTTLSAPHAVGSILGAAGYLALIGVMAVAFGFVVRSTAGGISSLIGLLLVLPGIGQLLPSSWQRYTLPYLPSNAGGSMFNPRPETAHALSPAGGLLVLAIWVALSLVVAFVLLRRRDV